MEESNRLVTVICSTYNSANWIEGYLKNINNQFLAEFDIIFVDANSSDGSLQSIKKFNFREGISSSIVESETKINVYEAWNKAIDIANTPYIININTDDRLYPTGLLIYLSYANSFPSVDIFYGSCAICDDVNHKTITGLFQWPEYSHEVLLKMCIGGPFPMVKRESLIEDGLFNPEFTISGDYEMWLRMSKKGREFCKVVESVGSYYRNPEGISTKPSGMPEHIKQDILIRDMYK
jgi:glycosyltransferase involved in cell wall biosynthesis